MRAGESEGRRRCRRQREAARKERNKKEAAGERRRRGKKSGATTDADEGKSEQVNERTNANGEGFENQIVVTAVSIGPQGSGNFFRIQGIEGREILFRRIIDRRLTKMLPLPKQRWPVRCIGMLRVP